MHTTNPLRTILKSKDFLNCQLFQILADQRMLFRAYIMFRDRMFFTVTNALSSHLSLMAWTGLCQRVSKIHGRGSQVHIQEIFWIFAGPIFLRWTQTILQP